MSTLTHQISPHLLRLASADEPDAALLSRFATNRDEAAFAALVQRHGPMVLGVCRRALGDWHAAEDACQATFLALARNAARLRQPEALTAWLHGVAVRVSANARRAATSRRAAPRGDSFVALDVTNSRERDGLAEITGRELIAVLDAELARLPEAFRAPLVLCGLEGLSHGEAARRLGWSPGSVKGRLERGRERLRRRLARRGLTLSAASALLVASDAAAVWSVRLANETTRLALSEAAPPAIAALVPAATAPALVRRLALFTLLAASAAGLSTLGGRDAPEGQPPKQPQAEAKPEPATKVDVFGDPLPPGALMRFGTLRFRALRSGFAIATDGKVVAAGGQDGITLFDAATGRALKVLPHAPMPGESSGYTKVGDFALSPDLKTMYAVGSRPFLKAWDLATHNARFTITDPKEPLNLVAVAASANGKTVAAGSDNGTLVLLDARTGNARATVQRPGGVLGLAFAKDGRLAAAGERRVSLHDPQSGREVASFPMPRTVRKIAFHPDGKSLWVTQERPQEEKLPAFMIRLDAATGRKIGEFDVVSGMLLSLAVSHDGKFVAAGSWSGVVTLYEVASAKKHDFVIGPHNWPPMFGVAFDPDGKRLFAIGMDGRVRAIDVAARKRIDGDDEPSSSIYSVAFSPDGSRVAAAAGFRVHVWDARSGRMLRSWVGDGVSGLKTVSFLPDGKFLLTSGWDKSVRLWNADTGAEVRRICECAGTNAGAVLSPDGKIVATPWPVASTITLFDTATGRHLRSCAGHARYHLKLQFSADGRFLAGASDTNVRIWNVATGSIVREFPSHNQSGVALSPDGRVVAYLADVQPGKPGNRDLRLCFSDVESGKELVDRRLESWKALFSPDGRYVVVAVRGGLKLIELATGSVAHSIASDLWNIEDLTFSQDGRRLLVAYGDGFALMWDLIPPALHTSPQKHWEELGGEARGAWGAISALAARPAEAVVLLREKLRPAVPSAPVPIAKLVSDLGAAEFTVREAASRELRLRVATERAQIKAARDATNSAEIRRRLNELLDAAPSPWADINLRETRALTVLEQINTPASRALLAELAKGAPSARLTREAATSLRRAMALAK